MLSILTDIFLEFNEWWEYLLAGALLFIVGSGMAFAAHHLILVWGGIFLFLGLILSIGVLFCAFGVIYALWLMILSF